MAQSLWQQLSHSHRLARFPGLLAWPGSRGLGSVVVVVVAVVVLAGAGGEPVEQPCAGVDCAGRDPAHGTDQRIRAAVPRVLVGLCRGAELVADAGAGVVLAALVVAAQDVAVLAVLCPPVELGEPDNRERVRGAL